MSSSAAQPDALAGVFVTGTGTEVGKSVVAAVLARAAAAGGRRVAVFKPAVSGLDDYAEGDALPDHALLRQAAGSAQSDDEIAPYRYGPPVSPHLAAELEGTAIDPARLREGARAARAEGDYLVCEGVGGFLVPLTLGYLIRDFAIDLALPVVIAASPGLGTINHTLLTVEAVRGAGLDPAAVVLTPWPATAGDLERSNRDAIQRLGDVRVAELPALALDDPSSWPDLRVLISAR
jgi:dethiobiotin synthetase